MTQQVKELIDKIKKEGIQEAEQKAKAILSQAEQKAQTIIQQAQQNAQKIIAQAEQDNQKKEQVSEAAIKQSARDLILNLRKEINKILSSIIATDVKETLTSENLKSIIEMVIKNYIDAHKDVQDISVILSSKDLDVLKKGFLQKLQEKIKKSITFHSSEGLKTGFTISFDQGKSSFDFSDTSLIEYLGEYLKKEIFELLKETNAA